MKHHHDFARGGSNSTPAPGWRRLAFTLAAAAALAGCDSMPARSGAGDASGAREPSGITVYGTIDAGVQRQR